MPLIAYVAIMVVALFSVALEWDTLVAPSDSAVREMQAANPPPMPPPQLDTAQPPPAADQTPQPKTAAVAPPGANAGAVVKTGDEAPKPAAPACDVDACSAAYRTFRASDCTYAPSLGERRLCTKGTPPVAVEAQATGAAPPKCNVEACRAAYFTFNPVDCTYQPADGPRRLCEK